MPGSSRRKSVCHNSRRYSPSVIDFSPIASCRAISALDLAILDLGERLRRNLAARTFGARVFQRGRAQQAADMVSPERRTRTRHRR